MLFRVTILKKDSIRKGCWQCSAMRLSVFHLPFCTNTYIVRCRSDTVRTHIMWWAVVNSNGWPSLLAESVAWSHVQYPYQDTNMLSLSVLLLWDQSLWVSVIYLSIFFRIPSQTLRQSHGSFSVSAKRLLPNHSKTRHNTNDMHIYQNAWHSLTFFLLSNKFHLTDKSQWWLN